VSAALDRPLRPLDDELRGLDLRLGRAFEGTARDGRLDRAAPAGDLLRPHADEHDAEVQLGLLLGERRHDLLQQRRRAGAGRTGDRDA
jgi:hypothetical protein